MKRGWVWIALLLSVGINIGVLATIGVSRSRAAARWERPREEDRTPPFERVANHLELEGDARQQFLEIQQRLFRNTREHQQALLELRGEMRSELMSDRPDPSRLDQLLEEVGAVQMELDRTLVASVLATRKILTPEQQQRYLQILERMQGSARRLGSRSDGPLRRPGRRPPPPDRP